MRWRVFWRVSQLPDKSVVISFDDGYLDNWVYARQVLEQYGLHAVLFLNYPLAG